MLLQYNTSMLNLESTMLCSFSIYQEITVTIVPFYIVSALGYIII